MKTPEQKHLDILKEQRSRRRWRFGSLLAAVVFSVIIMFSSKEVMLSLSALVTIWAAGTLFVYLSRHADTVFAYFRTIHRFLRENDATLQGHDTSVEQSDLSPDEANAFDDLVNRLKNS